MNPLPAPDEIAKSPQGLDDILIPVQDLREVNISVARAVLILRPYYTRDQLFEIFDRLMGYSTLGARMDTWSYVTLRAKGL